MSEVKKGRPFATKNPRVTTNVALSLQDGTIEKLLNKYSTTKKSEAIRKCIYEVLGINEETYNHKDTNQTRRKIKSNECTLN